MQFEILDLRNANEELSFVGFVDWFWNFFPAVVAPYRSLVAPKGPML